MVIRAEGSFLWRKTVQKYEKAIKTKYVYQIGPVSVWYVEGMIVRNHIYLDFTEGGNSEAYIWFPPNEIWLDQDVKEGERHFVLLHEITEMNQMRWNKLDYEDAHKKANVQELAARLDPEKFEQLLKIQKDIMINKSK